MAYEKERHERKHEYIYRYRKEILFVVVLASLLFATYVVAQTFYAPTVEKVLKETSLTEGAGEIGGTIPAVIETNESEEPEIIDPDPDRDGWSGTYDRTKLLPYVNETEIRWYEEEMGPVLQWDFGEIYTTFPVGCVFVNGERLCKGTFTKNDTKQPENPVELLEEGRKCSCLPSSVTACELFRIQGYTVKRVSAKRSTVSSLVISGHTWVEIEIDNKWYVIDNGWVFPLEEWIGNSVWVYDRSECLQCRY